MSRLMLTSDLHLGHRNICKYRTEFSSVEEHDNVLWDNLLTNLSKRDTLYLLGDITFTPEWLHRIRTEIPNYTRLIVGNHDTENGIRMSDLCGAYNRVDSLLSKRNIWFSHCPIHPQEMRGRDFNIHGHLHGNTVVDLERGSMDSNGKLWLPEDPKYINVCVEHTDFKPIDFQTAVSRHKELHNL